MNKNNNDRLEDLLQKLASSDLYPFHMPGHKRNLEGMAFDITEIDGFDDLHDPSGIIKKELDRTSSFYGTEQTFLSVNGSTAGILAAVSAAVRKGGRALVQSNSHISVYNALYLNDINASFIGGPAESYESARLRAKDIKERMEMASGDVLTPEDVEAALNADPENNIVIITSPTYDGYVADIAAIAGIVHDHGGILIVDEAHGAHFSMHPYFPESAVKLGADIVVQSLHKTLPALTQTALIHNVTGRVPSEEIKKYLDIFVTTSPSYVLMASAFRCLHMLTDHKDELFEAYVNRLGNFRRSAAGLENLKLLPAYDPSKLLIASSGSDFPLHDPSKILIAPSGALTAENLYDILRVKYHLQPEAVLRGSVLLMTSVMDTDEGFERLIDALARIDTTV